jgi:hypothetical protein
MTKSHIKMVEVVVNIAEYLTQFRVLD